MARIQFSDGTFTTRESHEVDSQTAVPEGAVLVDHGHVVTTGLPDDIPKTSLGVESVQAEEAVEVVKPEDAEKVKRQPKAAAKPRRAAAPRRRLKEDHPPTRAGATTAADLHPHHTVTAETDTTGGVPQGRLTFGDHDAERRNPGGDFHPDRDDD